MGQDGLEQDGLGDLAWPGTQDGLGQGRLRLKLPKGRFGSKNAEKVKVLRMEFSIVENRKGSPRRVFLAYLEAPNSIFVKKTKNWTNYTRFIDFPLFPLLGVPWAAVISL